MFSDSIPSLQDIDNRLASLRSEILTWNEIRNTHYSATSKLPSEILGTIFEYVSRERFWDGDHDIAQWCGAEAARYLAWIQEITHVCRAWRSIALASPRLWSSVLVTPSQLTAEVLHRTNSVPVDISFLPPHYRDPNYHSTLAKMMRSAFERARPERIRSIRMPIRSFEPDEDMRILHSSLSGGNILEPLPMPLLEKFSVINCRPLCHIPDTLFNCAPRLRHLVLRNCSVKLNTPRFHQLNSLRLSASPDNGFQIGLTLDMLCTALRGMHDLEVLVLAGVKLETQTSIASGGPIELPRLHTISLSYDPQVALSLLTAIKSAPSCEAEISHIHSVDQLISACAWLAASANESAEDNIWRSVMIRNTWETPEDAQSFDIRVEQHCEGGVTRPWRRTLDTGIKKSLDVIWSNIPRSNLRSFTLSFASADLLPTESVLDITFTSSLADYPSLHDIHAPYRAFTFNLLDSWNRTSTTFPSLRRLTLDCCNSKPKNVTLLWLRDWLVMREEQGLTMLECLAIDCPHFKTSLAKTLKSLVRRFVHSKASLVAMDE